MPYAWTAVGLNVLALVLLILPKTRMNLVTLNIGCVATYIGCYIEKGMGLILPGFTPSTLGEIYEYAATSVEVRVALGVYAVGALVFTAQLKVAVMILLGELRLAQRPNPTLADADAPALPASGPNAPV